MKFKIGDMVVSHSCIRGYVLILTIKGNFISQGIIYEV